jgi:hypothetical protein
MLHTDFVWQTAYNYTEHREIFRCEPGPTNGAVILMDVLSCFFLTKKSHDIFLEKLTGMLSNIRSCEAVFSFRSFVRSRRVVKINTICSFMSVLRGTVRGGRERNISSGIC